MSDQLDDTGVLAPEADGVFTLEERGVAASPAGVRTAILACGALAREILDVLKLNDMQGLTVTCLPAKLHNAPQHIPDRVAAKLDDLKVNHDRILVAYADCGTGGLLDKVIAAANTPDHLVERIGGPHCYAFFAREDAFAALNDPEPGTFYLTDYLVRHFDSLIVKGMGLDRYPEMRDMMFGNYTRLMYLAQTENAELDRLAEKAAERLSLRYERVQTGYGGLQDFLTK